MIPIKLREDAGGIIEMFIRQKSAEAKSSGVVIGMSGGLDSTLVAHLCVNALGREKVLGIMMPERSSNPLDLEHGIRVAKALGIEHMVVDITEPFKDFLESMPKLGSQLAAANVKARCRMIVLYMIANETNRLVMGCGNKTEIMVGYFTKFGDGGSDYLPIGDLYKTQVRELASRIGVDPEILKKAPSAGLWDGQTDEGEMGITYEQLDEFLEGRGGEAARATVEKLGAVSRHKRELPPIAPLPPDQGGRG